VTRSDRALRAVTPLLAALFWTGCGADGRDVGGEGARSASPLTIVGGGWTGIDVGQRALVTLDTNVIGSGGERIIGVLPSADPGLRVEYLGYSRCNVGCLPAAPATQENLAFVRRRMQGRFPIPVDRAEPVSLIFTLEPTRALGRARLRRGCLTLNTVSFVLGDGRRAPVEVNRPWLAGVDLSTGKPAGYDRCVPVNDEDASCAARERAAEPGAMDRRWRAGG